MLSQPTIDSDQENIPAKNIKSGAKCKNNNKHTGKYSGHSMMYGKARERCVYDELDTFTRVHGAKCANDVKHTEEGSSHDMSDERGVQLAKNCRKRKNPDYIKLENPLKKKQKVMRDEERSEIGGKSLKEPEAEERESDRKSLKESEEALSMSQDCINKVEKKRSNSV